MQERLKEIENQQKLADTLQFNPPEWALPLLEPARYKAVFGGRSCVAADTLLETPNGLIRVDEFQGGLIYSYAKGEQVTAFAGKPVKYEPEMLYKVTLDNSASIKVTAKHRFLSSQGWIEARHLESGVSALAISSNVDDSLLHIFPFLQHSNSEPCLSVSLSDVLHYWRTLLGFLYYCSEYFRQCDLLPLRVSDTYLDAVQQLVDGLQRNFHILSHKDVLESLHTHIPLQFLSRLSSWIAILPWAEQCSEALGSHNVAKFSERSSELCQGIQLSLQNSNLLESIGRFAELALSFYSLINQAQRLALPQQLDAYGIPEILSLFGLIDNSSYSDAFHSCKLYPHFNLATVVKVEQVGLESFYDLFVPFYNNYLSEGGIANHNSGKSHGIAEIIVKRMVDDPDLRIVCIREIQKSLKFSAKALIESKIHSMGVSHLFEILTSEIRRKNGKGICIFQGMQSHNADSIKSLEGFGVAWVEEAQNLSERSLSLLRPTIRTPGSELFFSWNPEQATDAVDKFFRGEQGPPPRSVVLRVNYDSNPFLPEESKEEMEIDKSVDGHYFAHIWLGEYNVKSDLQVFSGKWNIDEFEPQEDWDGPYFGADWGFANDPTTAVKLWIYKKNLFVEFESWAIGLEIDKTAERWKQDIPGIEKYIVYADCARPETISYVSRNGIPYLRASPKWNGSVADGIEYLRGFDSIIVHPRCNRFLEECRLYQWRTNAAGDILPEPLDKFNHCFDSARYALNTLIREYGSYTEGQAIWSY